MADTTQPHLNGSSNRPPIPRPQHFYHRPSPYLRCHCGPCFWGIFCISVIITIVGGIIMLITLKLKGVIGPKDIKFDILNASLLEFNLTNNTILHYNLAVNMTLRNPNRIFGIRYQQLEFKAYYREQSFDSVSVKPFFQSFKVTTMLSPVFQGQSTIVLAGSKLNDFISEKSIGVFNIDIELFLRYRVDDGENESKQAKPKIMCDLGIPLQSSNGTFTIKKCEVS